MLAATAATVESPDFTIPDDLGRWSYALMSIFFLKSRRPSSESNDHVVNLRAVPKIGMPDSSTAQQIRRQNMIRLLYCRQKLELARERPERRPHFDKACERL